MGERVRRNSKGEWVTDKEHSLAVPQPNPYRSDRPHFSSQEEMIEAIKDERYKHDADYRAYVAQLIDASDANVIGVGEQRPEQGNRDVPKMEACIQYVKDVFGSPEYKNSAIYRAQVYEAIRTDPSIEAVFGGSARVVGGVSRFEAEPTLTGPFAPAPPVDSNQGKPENDGQ